MWPSLTASLPAFARGKGMLTIGGGKNTMTGPSEFKSQQLKVKNPNMGVDCKETGTNDMKEQGVFETLIGKQQQMLLATQVVKLILKIDDVITSGKYD